MMSVEKFLGMANKAKRKYGLSADYCAMLPMLKTKDNQLLVVVPFVHKDAKIWTKESAIIPKYWCLIDPSKLEVIEFNKTIEKSFSNKKIIPNHSDDSFQKEISKYVVKTKIKYKEYIQNDIMNHDLLTYQKEVEELVHDLNINDEMISWSDYFYARFESDINKKVDQLVDLIASVKYNSLTTYYDVLFTDIVTEYQKSHVIHPNKLHLACDMMNAYYSGVSGIENIFYN